MISGQGSMKISRRQMLALAGAALVYPASARAASWRPSKSVRLVVPFAAGGANDIIARVLGERLSTMWQQQVYIDNKPGASSNIGSADVARSDPDGAAAVFEIRAERRQRRDREQTTGVTHSRAHQQPNRFSLCD